MLSRVQALRSAVTNRKAVRAEQDRRWHVLTPSRWAIATRSAAVSSLVVLVSLGLATAIILALVYGSLLASEDDACVKRVTAISEALRSQQPQDLDDQLFTIDSPLLAIQIVDHDGRIVRASNDAPTTALVALSDIDTTMRSGIAGRDPKGVDLRVSGITVGDSDQAYTVLVGADGSAPTQTVKTAALLVLAAAPLVLVETAMVNHLLVKRSLRSVDAIRLRVSEMSTSDAGGRVPVPDSRDEIAALATTMNDMLARMQHSNAAQRRFVGDASHELRSPLAGIVSTLEVIEAHPQLLSYDLVVGSLLPQANRMTALVDGLLLLARADEGALQSHRDVVDVSRLIAAEVDRLRELTTLTVNVSATPGATVVGNEISLSRVLRNLADNAARHARTRLDMVVETTPQQVQISVSDDGPGIPVAQHKRVFDRFVRLDSDRSRTGGGSGLGLAIVAELVANHGGTVSIDSAPAGGARVTVLLPRQA